MAQLDKIREMIMQKRDEAARDAEQFVRLALSHFSGLKVKEGSIKTAAKKASESLRYSHGKEPVAA